MDSLLAAIQARFNASAELTTRFATGLYHALGANDLPLPVVTVKLSNTDNSYETCNSYESLYRVHFDIWADSDTATLAAIAELEAAFDFGDLDVDGFTLCEKVGAEVDKEDETVWRGMLDYDVYVDRTY